MIPSNIHIAKMNSEKAIVYSGTEFIGRVEHYPIFSKIAYFAESPDQNDMAVCNRIEDAIEFLVLVREANNV